MFNRSCLTKRILSLIVALCLLCACVPVALADNYLAAVYGNGLSVYADASCTQKVAELDRYTVVTVTAVNGDVARIKYGGYTLYTASAGVKSIEDFAQSAQTNQNTYVFESPDTTAEKMTVKKGTALNLLATNGNWAMVEKNGYVGYTYKGHIDVLSTEDPFQPEISDDTAENGSTITGGSNVVIQTIEASVSSTKLPVYKSASTSSQKLGNLYYGQKVTVYAYNEKWAYIGLNNRYGFCALSGLVRGSISTSEPETPSTDDNNENNAADLFDAIPAIVTASSVVVYESASTSSAKLGKLNQGAEVNVLKTGSGWAYIELNGNYGYCALSALTKTSELEQDATKPEDTSTPQVLGTATVITATAKLTGSKTGGDTKATLSMGDTVSVYDYGSNWALVTFGEQYGYMAISSLSAQSYAELKEEDSGSAVSDLNASLLSLGYFDGTVGTGFTAQTADAIKRLQAACGMTQTGVADEATLRVLYSGNAPKSPILSVSLSGGGKGDNVTRIQTRLLALGYLSTASSVDGDYGSTTAKAVGLFQTASGASATGTADSATIRALYSASAVTLPSGSKPADYKDTSSSSSSSANTGSISSDLASTTTSYNSSMSNAQKLEYVIYVAQQQLGKKYVYATTGPNTFDCSGLTYYCFKKIGVTLKRTAYADGYDSSRQKISGTSSLKRGDLVFFNTVSDGDLCDHIGIYLGNGHFIHASSGAGKVVVSDLRSGYYNRVYSWGRRVLDT